MAKGDWYEFLPDLFISNGDCNELLPDLLTDDDSFSRNWDELLPDLLTVIVNKVDLYEDFVAFGGVCRSWRSAALVVKADFNRRQQLVSSSFSSSVQPPWLMLAEEEGTETREFVNISKGGMSKKMELPEARGKRCIGSMGWLITISEQGAMDLLHPLTRVSISLPHLRTYPLYDKNIERHGMYPVHYIYRATLSASPSVTQDYAVMLILGVPIRVAFWKPGNAGWMFVETNCDPIDDVTYHKGKFYAVAHHTTKLVACDVGGSNPTVEMVGTIPRFMYLDCDGGDRQIYLAEYCGDLILVQRLINSKQIDKYWSMKFRICKLAADGDDDDDSRTRRRGYYNWEEVNDLGGGSIFVGFSTPISVPCAAAVGLKPNCIYFTDDYLSAYATSDHEVIGGIDMGIYNLATKSTEPLCCRTSLSNLCPPMWVSPSF